MEFRILDKVVAVTDALETVKLNKGDDSIFVLVISVPHYLPGLICVAFARKSPHELRMLKLFVAVKVDVVEDVIVPVTVCLVHVSEKVPRSLLIIV